MRLQKLADRRSERERATVEAGVTARLVALDEVISAGEGRLDIELLAPARALARRAGERLRLSGSHTVVALAGATGSGKSSMFNALSGVPMSTVGVRRPTTGVAHAMVWGPDGAGPLLDWLQIPRRHHLEPEGEIESEVDDPLAGLVLLDLPDHDSTTVAHRLEVDRLVKLVDVLVWVLDPQKYADAAVHDRYLRPLAGHAEVMVVVLNQADRLGAQTDAALDDLRGLLARDGLGPVPVLATSTVTPGGLDGLRTVLVEAVAAHRAALRRVAADLDGIATDLSAVVAGPARESVGRVTTTALTSALSAAAGVPEVATAVQKAYVHRATASMGSPFTRWIRLLRPDPLRRLHLDRASRPAVEAPADPRPEPRTSVPAPTPVERSRVDLALRTLADTASDQLPPPWPDTMRTAARSRSGDLTDALDRAVSSTELGLQRKPVWWRLVGAVQTLLAFAAVAGGLWLAALYVLTLFRLPEPSTPMVGNLPVPTLLLLGGVLAGLVVAVLAKLVALLVARRRRARAESRLRSSVAAVSEEMVLDPVRTELSAYATLRSAIGRLRQR